MSDATPSTPPTYASPDILDDSGSKQSADRQVQHRKRRIEKRKKTRGRPLSIIVLDTVTPPFRVGAGAEVDAPVRKSSQSGKVQAIQRTSSTVIGRRSPTCPADYAFTKKTSRSLTSYRGKRRKLASNRVSVSQEQKEIYIIPASRANTTSKHLQFYRLDKEASKILGILSNLLGKLSLISNVEVLRDLKHTLFYLRFYPHQSSLVLHCKIETLPTSAANNTLCLL